MRKINVLEFVSLDGVIQSPGGPEEDTSGGFAHGGWWRQHADPTDPVSSTAMKKQMNMPFDLLLGRTTFDIWAKFWPQHGDSRQYSDQVRCLEYRNFSRMAAVRVSQRRYCRKDHQT
jgi:dihydrofolate reductase